MATQALYRPDRIGDWGTPVPVAGGAYGTDTLKLADGTDIFFRYWRAVDPAAPVLVLLHGLGAHSGWFIDMGNQLNALGLTVFIDDHRGFGRSGGPRGHVRRGRVYLDDISAYLDEVQRRRPGAPLFVLGHSMGGIFATYLAAADARTGRTRIKGLILANPWIKDVVPVKPGAVLGAVVNGALGSSKLLIREHNIDEMTLSAEAVSLLNADSYWVRDQSYAFLYQITRMRMGVLKQAAAVTAPALVVQGEKDLTLSQPATRACYEALGSADKTWKTYPEFAHDFEFETGRGALDADLADWIMRHRA